MPASAKASGPGARPPHVAVGRPRHVSRRADASAGPCKSSRSSTLRLTPRTSPGADSVTERSVVAARSFRGVSRGGPAQSSGSVAPRARSTWLLRFRGLGYAVPRMRRRGDGGELHELRRAERSWAQVLPRVRSAPRGRLRRLRRRQPAGREVLRRVRRAAGCRGRSHGGGRQQHRPRARRRDQARPRRRRASPRLGALRRPGRLHRARRGPRRRGGPRPALALLRAGARHRRAPRRHRSRSSSATP